MPEDAEKRFERAMDRLFSSKSVSSPATPASSSAGAASPLKQGRKGIHTGDEAVNGSKGPSGSRASGRPPRVAGNMPTHAVSTFSSHQPVCRPWDRGDLFKRLATFKSMTWFGKPLPYIRSMGNGSSLLCSARQKASSKCAAIGEKALLILLVN